MEIVERTVEVGAPLESVFESLSDFESYPLWMRAVGDVRRTGRRRFLWRADAPGERRVEWETETVVFEPDRRLVWRSVGGDLDVEGEAVLSETENGTTLLRLVLAYGAADARSAFLVGRQPARQLGEDLARFARVAERRARDPRAARGERRRLEAREDQEEWHAAGPREARRAPDERAEHGGRGVIWGDARGVIWGDARGLREEGSGREGRFYDARRFEEERRERFFEGDERGRHSERGPREARHEEAVREAHRRRLEDSRRYREERERGRQRRELAREAETRTRARDEDERARYDEARYTDERDAARRRREDVTRPEERVTRRDERDRRDDERPYRPRHALTPRERGMFEGNPSREEFDRMSRRGVDRLLDEPPSRRWRGDD